MSESTRAHTTTFAGGDARHFYEAGKLKLASTTGSSIDAREWLTRPTPSEHAERQARPVSHRPFHDTEPRAPARLCSRSRSFERWPRGASGVRVQRSHMPSHTGGHHRSAASDRVARHGRACQSGTRSRPMSGVRRRRAPTPKAALRNARRSRCVRRLDTAAQLERGHERMRTVPWGSSKLSHHTTRAVRDSSMGKSRGPRLLA